jgi:DNA-binding transcriptional regulator YiaG
MMSHPDLEASRISVGLSISAMARALGIHRGTYDKWERGEQRPPAVALTAIEMLLFMHSRGELRDWVNRADLST